jgi:hypothetical protein
VNTVLERGGKHDYLKCILLKRDFMLGDLHCLILMEEDFLKQGNINLRLWNNYNNGQEGVDQEMTAGGEDTEIILGQNDLELCEVSKSK